MLCHKRGYAGRIGGDHTISLPILRRIAGKYGPVAPGTGTPEPGGLTGAQGLEVMRGLYGLNLVGGDLVEVSPPYDTSGNTALLAANLIFEMLCSMPGCVRRN